MPETPFDVRWPDGSAERCYSPSRAIKDHLAAGQTYGLGEFLQRSRAGLESASERVRARYGYACSASMEQLARIEATARRFEAADAQVTVVAIHG